MQSVTGAAFRTVYLGGAGVVQALDSLQSRGLAEPRRSTVPISNRYEPDSRRGPARSGVWMGETGIRLVLQQLSPSKGNADRLAQLIAANAEDERRELMWNWNDARRHAMYDLTGEAVARPLARRRRVAPRRMGSGWCSGRSTSTGWWTSSSVLPTGSQAASWRCLVMLMTSSRRAAQTAAVRPSRGRTRRRRVPRWNAAAIEMG